MVNYISTWYIKVHDFTKLLILNSFALSVKQSG